MSPQRPRLSIVMPVLDEAARLPRALGALSPLRAEGAQVIAVDGGSRDDSAALLFLHADTLLPPKALSLVRLALQAHAWGRFDVAIEGRSHWLPWIAALMNARSRASGIATGDQAIFVRRDTFDAVGGFPEQPLMEDIELSRRLRRIAGRGARLRAKVLTSGRRWDERGAWRTIALMWRLRLLYRLGVPAERLAAQYR